MSGFVGLRVSEFRGLRFYGLGTPLEVYRGHIWMSGDFQGYIGFRF